MRKSLLATLLLFSVTTFAQKTEIKLYPDGVPGLKAGVVEVKEKDVSDKPDGIIRLRNVTEPTLTVFQPKKKTSDASVIICPGGGYHILAFDHEGLDVAAWFAQNGVTAFVLKNRLPQEELFENPSIRPLQDAQQAMRYVRQNASQYGIDPQKIGIMGFSAGGHLAATTSTHFDKQVGEITDNTLSVRPAFSVLIYPVISFSDRYGHLGSRDNLIGKDPSIESIEEYSNELHVTKNTPPTFLIHAFDDFVKIDNSLNYMKALKKADVASELHLYDRGGHGFSLKKQNRGPVESWPDRLADWMKLNGWM